MEILEAYDLTGCAWSAAALAGCDAKTITRHVAVRDGGGDPYAVTRRARLIDPFLDKVEEWVDRSDAAVRADVVHQRLVGMGFGGDERSTRRAVAEAENAWRDGHRRRYRPWVPEPGMWLQFDWGEGPRIGGRRTNLFCVWLAWSRYRLVIPTWDRTMGTLVACLDQSLRAVGGAPTYLLTDNEKTVTIEHVAGVRTVQIAPAPFRRTTPVHGPRASRPSLTAAAPTTRRSVSGVSLSKSPCGTTASRSVALTP